MCSTSISADWHNDPDHLKDCVRFWIRRGKAGGTQLAGAGDGYNLLPLGRKAWSSESPSIVQLAEELDGYPFDYICGNHDPFDWMVPLFAPWPNIKVSRELTLTGSNGHVYHISHGHQWALDWGIFHLNSVAAGFTEWMVKHYPVVWYNYCASRGWLASEDLPEGVEHEALTPLTLVIRAGALRSAVKNERCEIFGHDHTCGRETIGVAAGARNRSVWVAAGNLPDGTYVQITDDARYRFM